MEIRFFEPGNHFNQGIQNVDNWTPEELFLLRAIQCDFGRTEMQFIKEDSLREKYMIQRWRNKQAKGGE